MKRTKQGGNRKKKREKEDLGREVCQEGACSMEKYTRNIRKAVEGIYKHQGEKTIGFTLKIFSKTTIAKIPLTNQSCPQLFLVRVDHTSNHSYKHPEHLGHQDLSLAVPNFSAELICLLVLVWSFSLLFLLKNNI